LDVDSIFKPAQFEGKVVLVTGGNRGIGNSIAKELMKIGAETIITTRAPFSMEGVNVIDGIDVVDKECGEKLVKGLNGKKIDILINNAGYFYEPVEKVFYYIL
jgi:NAD(P)-dependent dehydrogenase (short-subunit alcohol dehydrogenase family)